MEYEITDILVYGTVVLGGCAGIIATATTVISGRKKRAKNLQEKLDSYREKEKGEMTRDDMISLYQDLEMNGLILGKKKQADVQAVKNDILSRLDYKIKTEVRTNLGKAEININTTLSDLSDTYKQTHGFSRSRTYYEPDSI